jgi:hypothetical protein
MPWAVRRWPLAVCCCLGVSSAACSRTAECELPGETARTLDLEHVADREHLAIDLAAIERVAARYGEWAGAHPPRDASHVTVEKLRSHARAYCEAILTEQIAARHRVSVEAINEHRAAADPRTVSRR